MAAGILIVLCIVLLDQVVKYWAVHVLAGIGSIPLIEGVFHFTYVENIGAAFSILQGRRWFFVLFTVLVSALFIYWAAKGVIWGKLGKLSVCFIIGGAFGNLIDRVRLGYVIDMLEFRFVRFAIFNVADSFVTIGGILLAVWYLFIEGKQKKGQDGRDQG